MIKTVLFFTLILCASATTYADQCINGWYYVSLPWGGGFCLPNSGQINPPSRENPPPLAGNPHQPSIATGTGGGAVKVSPQKWRVQMCPIEESGAGLNTPHAQTCITFNATTGSTLPGPNHPDPVAPGVSK